MELFVIKVNGFQPLTIMTKCSMLDVAAVLDPSLSISFFIYMVGFSLLHLVEFTLTKVVG